MSVTRTSAFTLHSRTALPFSTIMRSIVRFANGYSEKVTWTDKLIEEFSDAVSAGDGFGSRIPSYVGSQDLRWLVDHYARK